MIKNYIITFSDKVAKYKLQALTIGVVVVWTVFLLWLVNVSIWA